MANDVSPVLLNINLFPNDGLKPGDQGPPTCYSLVALPDGQQVQVTAADFLAGWQGRVPPFSNNDLTFRENVSLHQGITYECPGWANNDLKSTDARGNKILLQRNGRDMPQREGEGPPTGDRKMLRYLNVTVKVRSQKPKPAQAPTPAPAPPPAAAAQQNDYSEFDL